MVAADGGPCPSETLPPRFINTPKGPKEGERRERETTAQWGSKTTTAIGWNPPQWNPRGTNRKTDGEGGGDVVMVIGQDDGHVGGISLAAT